MVIVILLAFMIWRDDRIEAKHNEELVLVIHCDMLQILASAIYYRGIKTLDLFDIDLIA